MTLSIKMLTLATGMMLTSLQTTAQNDNTPTTSNRHSVNLSYSDGLTLGTSSFWGMGLSDALTGTKRTDNKCTGVISLGYRYALNKRFSLGMDMGFAKVSSKIEDTVEKKPYIKEKELNLMVLPTIEVSYLKRNLFEIYGSASAGANFCKHSETGLTEKGKNLARKESTLDTQFAYQINPIGIRIGNQRVGGFAEAGFGYKGFITAGVSIGF